MLDDPRVNFAISERSQAKGLDHLGIQAENAGELAELGQRLKAADLPRLAQPDSNCCYAKSDKHWSLDPSGIAWEAFHTLDSIRKGKQASICSSTGSRNASEIRIHSRRGVGERYGLATYRRPDRRPERRH